MKKSYLKSFPSPYLGQRPTISLYFLKLVDKCGGWNDEEGLSIFD